MLSTHAHIVALTDSQSASVLSQGCAPSYPSAAAANPVLGAVCWALERAGVHSGEVGERPRHYLDPPLHARRRVDALCLKLNSHLVNAPHMVQLAMVTFELRNRSWGWPSGLTRVLPRVCRGFETVCNDFLFSRLLKSQGFLCRCFMIAIETTFTVIDCIGDYYYYDDNSESYPTSVY